MIKSSSELQVCTLLMQVDVPACTSLLDMWLDPGHEKRNIEWRALPEASYYSVVLWPRGETRGGRGRFSSSVPRSSLATVQRVLGQTTTAIATSLKGPLAKSYCVYWSARTNSCLSPLWNTVGAEPIDKCLKSNRYLSINQSLEFI